jgi:hypothetical protein
MQLTLRDELPFVTVTVSHGGTTVKVPDMLVDTGSASTLLNADVAASLGIVPEPTDRLRSLRGVGGREVVFARRIDRLEVGPRSVSGFGIEIVAGRREELTLGNLQTIRDWGYSPDYAEAAVRILDAGEADDYVVATGEGHTVEELVAQAFALADKDWRAHVRHDAALDRSSEVAPLIGDPGHIAARLGWRAHVRFPELVRLMLDHDLRALGVAPLRL